MSVLTRDALWSIIINMEMGQIYSSNNSNKSAPQVLNDTARNFCCYISSPSVENKKKLMYSIIDLCFRAYSFDEIILHITNENFAYENSIFLKKDIFEKLTLNSTLINDILVMCHEFSHINDSAFMKNKKELNEYGDEKLINYTDKCDKLITSLFGMDDSHIFHDVNASEQRANSNGFKIIEKLLNQAKKYVKENNLGSEMLENVSEYKETYFSLKKSYDDKVKNYIDNFDIKNYKQKIQEAQNNYLECFKNRQNINFSEQISVYQSLVSTIDLFKNDELVEKISNLIDNINNKCQYIEYKKLLVSCQNYKITKKDIFTAMEMTSKNLENVFDIFECMNKDVLIETVNDYFKEKNIISNIVNYDNITRKNNKSEIMVTNFNQENNI